MKPSTTTTALLAALAAFTVVLNSSFAAEPVALKLAPIFGDHMVLQREMPVPIWVMAVTRAINPATANGRHGSPWAWSMAGPSNTTVRCMPGT